MNQTKPLLFTPLQIKNLNLKNRIVMSPMCQYSAKEGVPNDWHQTHLMTRAVGGVGLVMVEATGVSPEGRITDGCTGIWNDTQKEAFKKIVGLVKRQGTDIGIQLAHAGRKGSRQVPSNGDKPLTLANGGWIPPAPSPVPFYRDHEIHALNVTEMKAIIDQFVAATKRASEAGFDLVELHFAHGYLIHQFLSPLSNIRNDQYGGSLENRMRFPLELARAVRLAWGDQRPLFVRISATDWVPGGWTLEDSVVLAKHLRTEGIDLIDCSSGGTTADATIKAGPGYQVPFAKEIKHQAGIATGAVGIIVDAHQAEGILKEESADLIFLARELLRNPYFALKAAQELQYDISWPVQYERGKRRLPARTLT